MNLRPETLEKIDATIPKYPEKRSALMPVLHYIQAERGCISEEAIEWVAEKLDIEPVNVLSVVTFYPYYRQEREKLGKVHVRVCRTLSCALMGAYRIGDELERKLGCKMGTTREDGSVTLEYAECLASCDTGPVVLLDEKLYENLHKTGVDELVQEARRRAEEKNS